MKITGAIFDMDGTLLNSMDYWGTVAGEVLEQMGIFPEDDTNRRFLETGMRAWYDHISSTYDISISFEEMKRKIYSAMEEKYESVVMAKQGAIEMLEELSRRGVKMCLATATDRPTVEKILKRLDMEKYFSRIFTSGEVGVGKGEPLIYELSLSYLGTPKETTYVFEDAYYALKTAHNAGFNTIGIYDKNVFVPLDELLPLCTHFLDEGAKYRLDKLGLFD